METIIAFLLAGWMVAGGGSVQTAVSCQVGVGPTWSVIGYECLVGIGESNFVLTGMVYPVEAEQQRAEPEVESY